VKANIFDAKNVIAIQDRNKMVPGDVVDSSGLKQESIAAMPLSSAISLQK